MKAAQDNLRHARLNRQQRRRTPPGSPPPARPRAGRKPGPGHGSQSPGQAASACGSEVIEFQRATRPLLGMLTSLEAGFDKYKVDLELQRSLRDVPRSRDPHRRASRLLPGAPAERADRCRPRSWAQQQNDEMRSLTEASLAQNEEVMKISAWAAILFAPDTRRRRSTA